MKIELEIKDIKEFQKHIWTQVENVVRKIIKADFETMIKTAINNFSTTTRLQSTLDTMVKRYVAQNLHGSILPKYWESTLDKAIRKMVQEETVKAIQTKIDTSVEKCLTDMKIDSIVKNSIQKALKNKLKF